MKTLLFVDDERRVLQGLQRQLRGMRHDWNMHFVESGEEALEFMERSPVDVVVSDMMMPGMDGADLLERVMERHPQIVRIVLSGHAKREAILRLVGPAHQYISKPCDADYLRQVIHHAFALREILDNDRLKKLAARVRCLPVIPAIYEELTRELRNEDCGIERIGEIISHDIGISAKLLQLVNSAFFGVPQRISSPAEAVCFLGVRTLRELVLAMQVYSQYEKSAIPEPLVARLATHGWEVAVMARAIAELKGADTMVRDQCFVSGLLHDLGKLVLLDGLPGEYADLMKRARATGQATWLAEKEMFGASHAEVGAYMLSLWGLPDPIVEAVALHHNQTGLGTRDFCPAVAVRAAEAAVNDREGRNNFDGEAVKEMMGEIGLLDRLNDLRQKCSGMAA